MTKLVSTVLVAVFALSSFASDIKIKYDDYIEELKHRNKKRYEKYKKIKGLTGLASCGIDLSV